MTINLVLIVLGAYFGTGLFYQIIGLQLQIPQAQSSVTESGTGASLNATQPLSYYRPILERDLFQVGHKAQTASVKPSVDLENLEKTQLSLKLWGTVSGDPEQAYAVIEDTQKREQNLYRVGDSIQHASIKMILREKIILNVDGKDEVLAMEEGGQPGGMMAAAGGRRIMPMSAPQAPREQQISLQRSMIDESFQDMNKLMTQIAIVPNMQDGQPAGLSLSRIAPDSIFRRMGLRNGDVLLGVNGQPIQSAEDAMRIYEGLKSETAIQLQLKRRGQERSINYNIR